MKVLETNQNQNLFPIQYKNEEVGQVGDKIYGTFMGNEKEDSFVKINESLFAMNHPDLKNKVKGDTLEFNIVKKSNEKLYIEYISEGEKNQSRKMNQLDTTRTSDITTFVQRLEYNLNDQKDFNKEVKEHIEQVISRITQEDATYMMEEGINPEKINLEDLNNILTRIKNDNLGQSDIKSLELEKLLKQFSELTGNKEQLKSVISKLKQFHLPINQHTISKVIKEINKIDSVINLNDSSIAQLLKDNKELNLGNLYKAKHTTATSHTQNQEEIDFEPLEEQIRQIIEQTEREANTENINKAKWLIKNDIPLTKDMLLKYEQLKELPKISMEDKVTALTKTISKGKSLEQTELIKPYYTVDKVSKQKFKQINKQVKEINEEQIKNVIKKELPITIKHLNKESKQKINLTEKEQKNFITAKRQLEEIRLRLTYNSVTKLMEKGIKIETEPLEKIVEELKENEQMYNQQLLKESGVEATEENKELLTQTSQQIKSLQRVPMTILGKIMQASKPKTIEEMHKIGIEEQQLCERAHEKYETLQTQPRKDLGDSLIKTYDQINPILEDLGLETTRGNQRAIKILAHNEMPITNDNVITIKSLDTKVNQLLSKLHPAVIVQMIKENKNPLNIPLEQLLKEIEYIKEKIGITNQERISSYIWRLEKNNQLSNNERDGLIGFYRLLRSIDKSEGKVAGLLLKQNIPINLNNMLTATRLLKHKKIDVNIDKEFGMLEDLKGESQNIQEQLKEVFDINLEKESVSNSTQYIKELIEKIKELSVPEKLLKLSEKDFKTLSLEKLVDVLTDIDSKIEGNNQDIQEKIIDQIQQINNVKEETITFMKELEIPFNVKNILASQTLLEQPYLLHKELINIYKKTEKDQRHSIDNIFKKILNTKSEDLEQNLNLLREEIESIHKDEEASITKGTSELFNSFEQVEGLLHMQEHLSKKGFFQVPIIFGDKLTQLNVHIIENQGTSKEVKEIYCSLPTDNFGKIKAKIQLINQELNVEIILESEENIQKIKPYTKSLQESLEKEGYKINNINLKKDISSKKFVKNRTKAPQKDRLYDIFI
ncbi:MAG: DUF6240 domain-containing protein [Eubacteriales bacterium]